MRKRYWIAAGAVVTLASASAFAFASPSEEPAASGGGADKAHTVRLPTGDVASLSQNGSLAWHPAEGREDVKVATPKPLDGSRDVIAIPTDAVKDVRSGKQDARQYNISELVRAGESDAASAKNLSQKKYDGLVPVNDQPDAKADDAQDVTVTMTAADGKPAGEDSMGLFINQENGEAGDLEFDKDGKAKASLPPGTYKFAAAADGVMGAQTVEVADKAVEVTMDGTKSEAIDYQVDQEAKLKSESVDINLYGTGDEPGGVGVFSAGDEPLRVIPTAEGEQAIGLEAKPILGGEAGGKPFNYNLSFLDKEKVKPSFAVSDSDLAKVNRSYDGIASDTPAEGCSNPLHDEGALITACPTEEIDVPGKTTEYFTADPKVEWTTDTGFIAESDETDKAIAFSTPERFEPGETERRSVQAPLGLYLGKKEEKVAARDGDQIAVNLPYLQNGAEGEFVQPDQGAEGKVAMTKEGKDIGHAALREGEGAFRLSDKPSGRFALNAEMSHDGTVTPLSTKTSVSWEFDSEYTEEATPLPVSAVNFKPEGLSNGYAKAGEEQKFGLDYVAQDGAPDTDLKDLSFEVSYDDGKNWDKVDVSQEGDSATGTLKHPGDAKFASIKATATDSEGNKVTQSTLRSIALK